jgi:DNA polymerase-3 subunit epsilon
MTLAPADLEVMATILERSGDYRVLRRLSPRQTITEPDGSELRLGIVLDTETTGLDPKRDEIIELAMVPFTFAPDGRIFEIKEPFHGLRQPSMPIPAEITKITGIDDAMVAGKYIDPDQVTEFVEPAVLVIAHHAAFDRPFLERFVPRFGRRCWACSMSEIDWRAEGRESTKLAWLLSEAGFFYERHRSVSDCQALIELLARPLPRAGVTAFAKLVEAARQPTWRIWAEHSPFEVKDLLKARGYRWNPGDDGRPKSWFIEVGTEARDDELAWLGKEIYRRDGVDLRIDRLTAYERFSS